MAIFRKIHVSFWKDEFVESLTPEQKYFYLYLLTNDRTTQCGIYEITTRQMSYDTGYNKETIDFLLETFYNKGKLKYSLETKEIALKNWIKYNDSSSPKVKACINGELNSIKNIDLIHYMGYEIPEGSNPNKNYRVSDKIREHVLSNSNYSCEKCGSKENLSIDHILPRVLGGKSIIENLRCLCIKCNSSRPLMGKELEDEIKDSGYNLDELIEINKKNAYGYSMRRDTQEEKEKEKEEEKERDKEREILFDSFWQTYDKKVGDKKKLFAKFKKLKNDEIVKIFEFLPKYLDATPDKQFRKNPETFLNNKSWNDEIIKSNNTTIHKPTISERNTNQLKNLHATFVRGEDISGSTNNGNW